MGDPIPVIRSLPVAAKHQAFADGYALTVRLGLYIGEYLRDGYVTKTNMINVPDQEQLQAWCNRGERERRVPVFAFDAPAPFVNGLLSLCVRSTFRSKPLAEGLALLLTRVGGWATLVEEGDGLYSLKYREADPQPSLRDVFLDPVATIEVVESSRPHVYDLTVAKTRNMVTESGLVQRDTFHSAGLASVSVTQGVPRFKEFMDATKNIKTPFCHARRAPSEPASVGLLWSADPKGACGTWCPATASWHPASMTRAAPSRTRSRSPTSGSSCGEAGAGPAAPAAPAAADGPRAGPFIVFDLRDPDRLPDVSVVLGNLIGGKFEVVPVFPSSVCVFWKKRGIAAAPSARTAANTRVVARGLLQLHIDGQLGVQSVHPGAQDGADLSFATNDMRSVINMPLLDPLSVQTNDVHAACGVLGVEAALNILFQEMQRVIEYDGNRIHWKHTYLLAENIMQRGFMCPITRHGMGKKTGVLLRASFETTTDVFNEGACHAIRDNVAGVTENIMFANRIPCGTGILT